MASIPPSARPVEYWSWAPRGARDIHTSQLNLSKAKIYIVSPRGNVIAACLACSLAQPRGAAQVHPSSPPPAGDAASAASLAAAGACRATGDDR